jgi:hypothetical protein
MILFALAMTMALGVKAPLNLSVFSAAGGALLLSTCASYPFSMDELLRRNHLGKRSAGALDDPAQTLAPGASVFIGRMS